MMTPYNVTQRGETVTVPWEFMDVAWARPVYPYWTVVNQFWEELAYFNKVDPRRNHGGNALAANEWNLTVDEAARTLTVTVPVNAFGGFYSIQYQTGEPPSVTRSGATIYVPPHSTFHGQEIDRGDGVCQTCPGTMRWDPATRRCW